VAIQINYKPLYFSQVRQNPRVTFGENNARIHRMKNAFLGQGVLLAACEHISSSLISRLRKPII